jgi:hypothetical protein
MMRLATRIGNRAFEAVADLDAHLAVVLGDDDEMPSSAPLRPIFHASATRIEYCSMLSGWVVGTSRTAIWLPRALEGGELLPPAAPRCVRRRACR